MNMTRYLCFLMSIVLFSLTGCQTDPEETPDPNLVKGVITVRSQSGLDNEPENKSMTKADGSALLTYTIEAWSPEEPARCVLHQTTTGTLSGGATFDILLLPGEYNFLFWADYGTDRYITSNLREVKLSETPYTPNDQHDAFAGVCRNETWGEGAGFNATLTRPLARLNVLNTSVFNDPKSVSVEYSQVYTCYDVLTGTVSVPQYNVEVVFPETAAGSASVGIDYLFVPSDGTSESLSVTVGDVTKTVSDILFKPNYNTTLTSSF